jgi:hypothetical protein
MVRFEVEISVSVDEFSAEFDGQCRLFPDDQTIQKMNYNVSLYFHNEVKGRPSTIEVAYVIL